MLLHKTVFIVIVTFLLVGCAPKQYQTKVSSFITIKTKSIKYSDMGFFFANDDYVKVQIYKFATPVFTLKMHSNICIDRGCFTYERFNARFLDESYPKMLLRQVFLAKPIFEGKDLKKTAKGFTQRLVSSEYDILYSVNQDVIRFQDKKNGILIKMKKLGE